MARTARINEEIAARIRDARRSEGYVIKSIKAKYEEMIRIETAQEHERVLDAVRAAVAAGMSMRQIGFAYGSSDPTTGKRLVEEAMAGISTDEKEAGYRWRVTRPYPEDLSLFSIKVYGLGEQKRDGEVLVSLDEDEVNITAQDGDFWIVPQLYREGLVPQIISDYWTERNAQ